MSAGDVSKNDRNHKTPMSEIFKSDRNNHWENKIKDELYSHSSSKNKLEENLQPTAIKLVDKSNLSVEKNDKNQANRDTNTNQQGFLPVLTNTNFLALWGGQVFCQLADKVYLVLMIALIDTQFQSEGSSISGWVSALMMTFTIPAVLFGSLAGVFVDRWVKKTVLVSTNIWRGILVFGIVPLLWLAKDWQVIGNIPPGFFIILAVTFLVSTLTQFFAPAEQAVIPLIVKPHNLLSANSLYTTTMMASVIVGFAIGEPLLSAADALWLQFGGSGELGKEILVGASYIIAGLILLLLVTNEKPQEQEKESSHIFSDLKDGFVYLGENHRLRNALIQLIILFSVLAALTVLAVRIAEIIPAITAEQFGFLLASGGVGIAFGAMILGQFGQNFTTPRLSLAGCMGMTISLAGLAIFTQQLWAVLSLIGLLGISGALVGIPLQTAIQTETPPQMHGKVFGLQNNLVNIALTLPLALAGIAETFLGLQTVFLSLAAIVFCVGILTRYKSA
ncbi:MAG: MFS transporter [Cyanobacteria bacterium J06633_8]